MKDIFIDSPPLNLSSDIFRLYQFCILNNSPEEINTGIMVEDGCFEFMFNKEKNIKLQIRDEKPINLPTCFSLGNLPTPYKFITPKTLTQFSVKVQPWVSRFFFPENDHFTDLTKCKDFDFNELHQNIFSTSSFQEMITFFEEAFIKIKMPHISEYAVSKSICERIYNSNGNLKITELMDQFPYSRQKLNSLFIEQTKNSIKEFAIHVRVRAIIRFKIQNPKESLTAIGLEFGYFDQSHFIKDIKKATGMSPSKFFSQENLFDEQLKLGN